MITPWVILHIPHASTLIPDVILKTFKISENELEEGIRSLIDVAKEHN